MDGQRGNDGIPALRVDNKMRTLLQLALPRSLAAAQFHRATLL